MKSCAIVLLSSFIIVCNADLDYMDVADKVVSELLKYKDPLNGLFDNKDFGRYVVNETKWYDWNRLRLEKSSVQGVRRTTDIHDLQFEINLPSPLIRGKLYYSSRYGDKYEGEIKAIPSDDIRIRIHVRINEFYSETAWKSVALTRPLKGMFVSQFHCKDDGNSQCTDPTADMDGEYGAWNQPSNLVNQVKRLLYAIKYF